MTQSHLNTAALRNILSECEKHQNLKKSLNLDNNDDASVELDTSIWIVKNWLEKNPSK